MKRRAFPAGVSHCGIFSEPRSLERYQVYSLARDRHGYLISPSLFPYWRIQPPQPLDVEVCRHQFVRQEGYYELP